MTLLHLELSFAILNFRSGLLQCPLAPLYITLPRGHTLMFYGVINSLSQPMVALGEP